MKADATEYNLVEKYFDFKNKFEEFEEHPNDEIYQSNFKGKSSEEIQSFLIENEIGETGGITALSGFYFQFLVTIEYIIELLENKWDFLIMEHRDDVVVGNNECIRFIQVKSSQYPSVIASKKPASDLYNRKSKEDKTYANSWIDKLIINSKKFYKDNNIRTEFQLYSNYQILRAPQGMNVEIYSDNSNYSIQNSLEIDELFKKLNIEIYKKDDQLMNFEDECGESLESLLKRLYVYCGRTFAEIDKYERYLCHKLGDVILKDYVTIDDAENITISKNDLKLLIGELFEKCTHRDQIDSLVITKESIHGVIEKLITNITESADRSLTSLSTSRIIQEVTEGWMQEFDDMNVSEELKRELIDYSNYFRNWILNDGISLKTVIERLHNASQYTNIYPKLKNRDKIKIIEELFILSLFYKKVKNDSLIFDNNKTMLIKKALNSGALHGLIRMEKRVKKEVATEKLIEILYIMTLEEELKILLSKDVSVAFFNCIPNDFKKTEVFEVPSQEINQLDNSNESLILLTEESLKINIYYGKMNDYFLETVGSDDHQLVITDILNRTGLTL